MGYSSASYDYYQSSVIPFRVRNGGIELLLITSWNKGRWGFPKGIIESHLSAEESALKEAEEEAGVLGEIVGNRVASYEYRKWGGNCHVDVFLMLTTTILKEWDESDVRKRAWVRLDQAGDFITRKRLLKVLEKAVPELCKICDIERG
jgi:8-oxo-dGTP pyrophosphatase MutT (NUDIX family)